MAGPYDLQTECLMILSHGEETIDGPCTKKTCTVGSGLGRYNFYLGDSDIQLLDQRMVRRFRLDRLRFGDLAAIADADHRFGRSFRTGAMTVGVVIHSDSTVSGHGPRGHDPAYRLDVPPRAAARAGRQSRRDPWYPQAGPGAHAAPAEGSVWEPGRGPVTRELSTNFPGSSRPPAASGGSNL